MKSPVEKTDPQKNKTHNQVKGPNNSTLRILKNSWDSKNNSKISIKEC